jgi:septal ring factor EnvC (AmiA/AmiB activator)
MTVQNNGFSSSATDQNEKPSVAELQADIERTREELGQTVDALSAKLDVKSRAKDRLAAAKAQLKGRVDATHAQASDLARKGRAAATTDEGKPMPAVLGGSAGAAVAVVAVVVAVVLVRRRR